MFISCNPIKSNKKTADLQHTVRQFRKDGRDRGHVLLTNPVESTGLHCNYVRLGNIISLIPTETTTDISAHEYHYPDIVNMLMEGRSKPRNSQKRRQ